MCSSCFQRVDCSGEFSPQVSGGDSIFRISLSSYIPRGCLFLRHFPLRVLYDVDIGFVCRIVVCYHCIVAANVILMDGIVDVFSGDTMCQNRRSDMMTSILSISDFQIFFWLKFILRYYIFIGRPEKF